MLVHGVLVVELVLDEVGEAAELGDELAEAPDLVHGADVGCDVAALVEDFEEDDVVVAVGEEAAVEERDLLAHELSEVRVEGEAALLAVEESPEEAGGVVAQDGAGGGRELAMGGEEAVEGRAAGAAWRALGMA